jgi:hypothetical protein
MEVDDVNGKFLMYSYQDRFSILFILFEGKNIEFIQNHGNTSYLKQYLQGVRLEKKNYTLLYTRSATNIKKINSGKEKIFLVCVNIFRDYVVQSIY